MKTRLIKQICITYFTCTRTEKHAAIVLGGALLLIQGWLFLRHHVVEPETIQADRNEQHAVALLQKKSWDSGINSVSGKSDRFRDLDLSPFDPNALDETGFVNLGMSPRQAASLIKYRDRIGGFRSKEDVKRVRVLDSTLFARWAPFIDLPERKVGMEKYPSSERRNSKYIGSERKTTTAQRHFVIDLNDADTILLKDLPWIGSGRAKAIVNYRERLGGFVTLEQLQEVRAIPDSVYHRILPFLTLKSGPYRKVEINRSPMDSLRHPYLSKQFARMIVSYRTQHGSYSSLDDLFKLPLADEEILRKLAPYLTF